MLHLGKLLALSINIRLGCTGLPETNTLAYSENSLFTDVKSYIKLVSEPNVIKIFSAVVYNFS